MNIVFVTSIRLLADGLTAGLRGRPGITSVEVVDTFPALRESLAEAPPHLVLIDVTQGLDTEEVRRLAADYPEIALWALGPDEQRSQVVRQGHGSFAGYVARSSTIDELCDALSGAGDSAPNRSCGRVSRLFAAMRKRMKKGQ